MGSLGYARSAQHSIGNYVASARSVHLNLKSCLGNNVRGGDTRTFTKSEESLKVIEYLGGGVITEKA